MVAIKDAKNLQDVLGPNRILGGARITLCGFAQEMVADGVPADTLPGHG